MLAAPANATNFLRFTFINRISLGGYLPLNICRKQAAFIAAMD
jgi:hypothetical protein